VNDFDALAYLECRRAANFFKGVVRQPGRMVLWGFFALWVVFGIWRRARGYVPPPASLHAASIVGSVVLAVGGALLWAQTRRRNLRIFTDPVDVFFVSRSTISDRALVAWALLRQSARAGVMPIAVMLSFAFSYTHGSPVNTVLALAGISMLFQIAGSATFFAARKYRREVAAAGLFVTAAALFELFVALARGSTPVGAFALALWNGSGTALAVLYLTIAAVFAVATFGARDFIPEAYGAARLVATFAERRRTGSAVSRLAGKASSRSSGTRLRGAWVELWKQAAFLRRRNGRTIALAGLGAAVAMGALCGVASQTQAIAVAAPAVFLAFVWLTFRATSLSEDVSKPLWWLGKASTVEKLGAWCLAGSMWWSAWFCVALAAYSAASRNPAALALGVLPAVVVPFSLRAVGVLSYALFPSASDQRGPAAMVRMLVAYVAIAVATVTGTLCAIIGLPVWAAVLGAMLASALEGATSLALASALLERRGIALAWAERT
jgi:hypothetical protein